MSSFHAGFATVRFRLMNLALAYLAAAFTLGATIAHAQLPNTRLDSVFPAGGQVGQTVEVTITGDNLDEAHRLHFSHPGITAQAKMSEPSEFQPEKKPVDGKFLVTIKPDVPPGVYDMHVIGRYGISNPRAFQVGTLKETVEKEPNNDVENPMTVELNSTVNGQADARNWDYFKLPLKKGQKVVVDCWAHRIDSRLDGTMVLFDAAGNELQRSNEYNRHDPLLAFTAPADGDYYAVLYDFMYGGGPEYYYRLTFSSGPYVEFVIPPAGEPGKAGKFTLYGRNLPGGKPAEGMQSGGQPLEQLTVDIQVPANTTLLDRDGLVMPEDSELDGFDYTLKTPQGTSNPVFIGFATAPVVLEKEPNNSASEAQAVSVPCEYVGQFNPRGDRDFLTFEAKQGDTYWMEVFSQRMAIPTDPYLLVQQVTVDKEGKEQVKDLREVDDPDQKQSNIGGNVYNTHTDDPTYKFVAPADGKYRVLIRDLYYGSRGAPRYIYRLSIRKETPDFRLIAVPVFPSNQNNQSGVWSPMLYKGGAEAIEVLAFRRDGFNEDIEVQVEGLPGGVTASKCVIGAGSNGATLVLKAADGAADWAGAIKVTGKAKVNGQDVVRQARAGTVVWPAVNNRSAQQNRMSRQIVLAVSAKEDAPYYVEVGEDKVYEMARAGKIEMPIKAVRRGKFDNNIALQARNVPQNVQVKNVTINKGKNDGKLEIELKNNAPVGTYTFHMIGQGQVPYQLNPEAAAAAAEYKKKVDEIVKQRDQQAKEAAKVEADKQKALQAAQAEVKKAEQQAKAAKDDQKAKADAELKAAQEKQAKADAEFKDAQAKKKEADDKLNAAKAEQKRADQEAKNLANRAKQKNLNVYRPSTAITVKITEAPIVLKVNMPGNLKQGEKIDVPVAVDRLYGYAEEINLQVTFSKGSSGLKVQNTKIEKGKNDTKLVIEAAPNAKPGDFQMIVKANHRFNNQNLSIDQSVPIKIEEVKKEAKK